MEQLRLQTLGHLGVEGSSFRQSIPLLLLTYLALEGPQIRRRVAELIWMGGKRPLHSLSMAINRLKQGIPGCIEADSERVWTNIACDASELLDLADKHEFEQCISLYKGSFLEDLNVSLAEELEEWVYGTRDFLALRAREAFLQTAEGERMQNKLTQAAKYAEQAFLLNKNLGLELEPEHFQRIYTLLLEANHPRAKEVKDEADDFGFHIKTIKRQPETDTKPPTTPNNLPTMQSSFIGRKQELADVANQFKQAECRLLTFHGMGGIGKSRLAIEAAFEQLEQRSFKDGIYFVALDALSSADLIPVAITEVLNIDLKSIDDTLPQVCEFIGEKQMLLVLDNFEHLIEGALLPSQLLKACPNLKLFVTSREVLNLEEEWVQNLEGLHYPEDNTISLEELKQFDAVDLFTQRAKKAKLEFSLSQDDVPGLAEICQLVEGAPLALELSAVWVRLMPLAEIAKEIKASIDFLQSQSKNTIERHQSIYAVFEHSWKLLSPKEQDAMRKLAIFVGSFSRQAASEVAGVNLPTLVSLMNKSLLRVLPNGRCTRHFLIYEFTLEKLKAHADDFTKLTKEHAHFYCQFLESFNDTLQGARQHSVIEELDLETENINMAFPHFFELENTLKLRSAIVNFSEYLNIKGRCQEGLNLFLSTSKALSGNNYDNLLALATLERCIGWFYYGVADFKHAQLAAEQSLNMLQASEHIEELARVYRLLYGINWYLGNFIQARENVLNELALNKKLKSPLSVATALNNLGCLDTKLGRYCQAEANLQASAKIDRELGSLVGLANDLCSLGELYQETSRYSEAEHAFGEGLEIANRINYSWLVPILLNGLSQSLYHQSQTRSSEVLLQEAVRNAILTKNEQALVSNLAFQVSIKLDLDDFDEIEDLLFRSLILCTKYNLKSELMLCLIETTRLFIKYKDFEIAHRISEFVVTSSAYWKYMCDKAQQLSELCQMPLSSDEFIQKKSDNPLSLKLKSLILTIIS